MTDQFTPGAQSAGREGVAAAAVAAVIIINGFVEHVWPCASEDECLRIVRRWYAIKRALSALTVEASGAAATDGPDPRTATEEEIGGWFNATGTNVVIDICEASPDPLTRELEAVTYLPEKRQGALRAAAIGAASLLG